MKLKICLLTCCFLTSSVLAQAPALENDDDDSIEMENLGATLGIGARITNSSEPSCVVGLTDIFEPDVINVLALDGGGVRGIASLTMLAVLEEKTGKKVQDIFDVIYGTSTGGLAGLLLAKGYPATKVLDIYCEHLDDVFESTLIHNLKSLFGILKARYSINGFEKLIKSYGGDSILGALDMPVAVTAVNAANGELIILSNMDESTCSLSLLDAARATSAAPTYFPSKIVNIGGVSMQLVDGGVAANNPSIVAYQYTRAILDKEHNANAKIRIFSIGTGSTKFLYIKQNTGLLGFSNPSTISSYLFGTAAKMVEKEMDFLVQSGEVDMYCRFQFALPRAIDLADTSAKARKELMNAAHQRSLETDFNNLIKMFEAKTLHPKAFDLDDEIDAGFFVAHH